MNNLDRFCSVCLQECQHVFASLNESTYRDTVQLIRKSEEKGGRLHITGIGKPGHLAGYIASLFSSTGTPAYFLHGTEAVHGSCGQLAPNDVVICISNSGETAELKATATAVRNNGCSIIAVTGKEDSWLARFADVSILAHVDEEGGVLNRAPRASILVEAIVLQGLSICLQDGKNLTPQEYVKRHPGGSLGKLRVNEVTEN